MAQYQRLTLMEREELSRMLATGARKKKGTGYFILLVEQRELESAPKVGNMLGTVSATLEPYSKKKWCQE